MNKSNLNFVFAALSLMAFFFLWDKFVVSRYAPPLKPSATAVTSTVNPAVSAAPSLTVKKGTGKLSAANPDAQITLRTDHEEVTLQARGAGVVSWRVRERDHWVEVVMPAADRQVAPLETDPDVVFAIQPVSDRAVTFTGVTADGVRLEKTLTLSETPGLDTIQLRATNAGSTERRWSSEIVWGNGLDKHRSDYADQAKKEQSVRPEMRAVGYAGAGIKTWRPGFAFDREIDRVDPPAGVTEPWKYDWVGIDNNHFLAAFVASDPARLIPDVHVRANRDHAPIVGIPLSAALKPGESAAFSYGLYVGPKRFAELKALDHHLDASINFGLFGPISRVLLKILTFFKNMTGNYGWAIVLLTLCLQLAVFPLTRKSLQHSIKMREVQPQIKALQEMYKSDPKRMQMETFNLYRKHGLRFMGMEGCFPVMLQIPLFFAFYSTLNGAYELRGAPFIFWIKDLSVHDPNYVLPILMSIGMFLQQKVSAVAVDPAQQRMMMFMPIIFAVMFIKQPAGLVLYWVVNSMTTIVLQAILRRYHPTPPVLRPA